MATTRIVTRRVSMAISGAGAVGVFLGGRQEKATAFGLRSDGAAI